MKNYDSTEATEIYENIPSCICSSWVVTVTDSFLCQPKREGKGKGGKGKEKKKRKEKCFQELNHISQGSSGVLF